MKRCDPASAPSRSISASWRTARGVRPSPQVFSRGKTFFSTMQTSQPACGQPVATRRPGGSGAHHHDVIDVLGAKLLGLDWTWPRAR